MAKTNRTVLTNNDQQFGEVADPNKLENSIEHAYDVIDGNDDEFITHKNKQVDVTDSNTTKDKHVSNSDLKVIHDDLATKTEKTGNHEGTWQGLTPGEASEPINGARIDSIEKRLAISVTDHGAVGDGVTDDTQAFLDAIAEIEALSTSGVLYVPKGEYLVTSDLTISNDYFTLKGEGKSSSIKLNGAKVFLDAVTKGTHIFGFTMEDIRLEREGVSGPALEMLGQNTMGVARWKLDNVHITSSSGSGLKIQGSWIWDIVACVVSGCTDNGIDILLAPDGNSSGNAGRFFGGEIQGNGNYGVYMESVSGISFFGTSVEGNSKGAVNITSNNRTVGFYNAYFEANGSVATDRDIIIGDVNYGGTKATSVSLKFDNCVFWDGTVEKDYAIELSRGIDVKLEGVQFNSYVTGGINVNPEITSQVTGSYERCRTDNGIIASDNNLFRKEFSQAIISDSVIYDFGSVSAGGYAYHDFTVTGVKNGDFVIVTGGSTFQLLTYAAFVHGPDIIRITLNNNTSSPIDLGNSTFRFLVIPYEYFM